MESKPALCWLFLFFNAIGVLRHPFGARVGPHFFGRGNFSAPLSPALRRLSQRQPSSRSKLQRCLLSNAWETVACLPCNASQTEAWLLSNCKEQGRFRWLCVMQETASAQPVRSSCPHWPTKVNTRFRWLWEAREWRPSTDSFDPGHHRVKSQVKDLALIDAGPRQFLHELLLNRANRRKTANPFATT